MPEFEKVYNESGGEIQFMMVNLSDGARETVEAGKKYINDGGYSFPVYFDTDQSGAAAYALMYIPATFFIDGDGYVVAEAQGAVDGDTLRQGIDLLTGE